jgi:hypothetical protein
MPSSSIWGSKNQHFEKDRVMDKIKASVSKISQNGHFWSFCGVKSQ